MPWLTWFGYALGCMQPVSPYQPPSSIGPTPDPYGNRNQALTTKQILFSFKGRIPRRTFWLWSLVASASLLILIAISSPLLKREGLPQIIGFSIIIPVVITFFWISLAVRVKRWHDHGKSGAWILIGMIPYVGALISFIFLGCMRGNFGHNPYGPDPT